MNKKEMSLLAYEVLIEDPSKYEEYKHYILIDNIEHLLMFRPEFIDRIDVFSISKYSWDKILSEQPQLIKQYLKCLNVKYPSYNERSKIVSDLHKKHIDLKYYL